MFLDPRLSDSINFNTFLQYLTTGANKWQFDIWSNDVVIANKMESTGVSGKIHITNATLELLHGEYAVEDGTESALNEPILMQNNIKTYLISPKYDEIVEVRLEFIGILTIINDIYSEELSMKSYEKRCQVHK